MTCLAAAARLSPNDGGREATAQSTGHPEIDTRPGEAGPTATPGVVGPDEAGDQDVGGGLVHLCLRPSRSIGSKFGDQAIHTLSHL